MNAEATSAIDFEAPYPDTPQGQQDRAYHEQVWYYMDRLRALARKGIKPGARTTFLHVAQVFARRDRKNGKLHTF